MSILKKPYELSLWEDDTRLREFKALVIGSDQMTSPDRALDVKFTCDVNGTHQLTFKMYYQYYDTQTGELVHNLFADQIVNESKVKLHYDDQWYDFVIKNIVKNSNDYSFQYTAQDLYIQELSKTGYNIEFSDELENNMDTIYNLVSKVVEGTDWTVNDQSDVIVQTQKEILFTGTLNTTVTNGFKKLSRAANGAVTVASNFTTLSSGTRVYLFYSDLADQSENYQILIPNGSISLDSDNVMLNTTQYRYYGSNTAQSFSSLYQLSFPSIINGLNITTYQGEKYIFSQETKIDTKLKKVLSKYTDGQNTYWGFIETEYNSPAMIRNFVSNPNNFQSTVGWRAGVTASGSTASLELDSDPSLIQKLKNGESIGSNTSYTPVLKVVTSDENTCLINTGIRDNLSSIKELCAGDQFAYYLKFKSNTEAETIPAFNIEIREISNYDGGVYTFGTDLYFIGNIGSFDSNKYIRGVGTVQKSLSYKDMKHKNLVIILWPSSGTYFDFSIIDFQMFRYVPYYDKTSQSFRPMLPTDTDVQGTITNHYCYFKDDPENPQEYTSIEDLEYESYVEPNSNYEPVMRPGCEKVRSINAKESNRFNIIQDLCETFECWASFDIEHNNIGRSLSKKITIHQYIGQDNPARFLNGVNLKSTSRTLDSNQLVTKLIVKPNSNQYADGGFCTIATATPNPSGETTILNFDYYINQQLLYPSTLVDDLYKYDNSHIGYYTRLKILNNDLIIINKQLSDLAVTIAQARAKVEKAKAGKEAAEDGEADVDATLERYWQINLNGIRALTPKAQPTDPDGLYEQLQSIVYSVEQDDPNAVQNKALLEQVTRGLEYQRNKNQFAVELADAESLLENYELLEAELKDAQEAKITEKRALDSAFFIKYHRFIQEGTWIDEKYVDDDLYFYDARSIGYESSMPKVTYQMSVIDVSVLPEYEGYTFKIGDRTYIQDPEFFGYTVINGIKTPAKEEVTVNKIVYSLDNPSATQITIQTYKNLFQDLFQKITATVQQVHYATGQYEKAAALAEAETAQKVEFLQDALNDAATILSNSADQTVVWDNTGITITNSNNTSEKLRLVSGGILLGAPNAWGETEWKVGVTAKGVSANLLTSGQLNTGVVQIMAGTEPTFRWDALGLTAYDYIEESGQIISTNSNQGVRFDRLGVYGFTGVDGTSWHPDTIVSWSSEEGKEGQPNFSASGTIRAHSLFELTKEGLYLDLGKGKTLYHYGGTAQGGAAVLSKVVSHQSASSLGKLNDIIYDHWTSDGIPYYTGSGSTIGNFVKIMSISNDPNNETMAIYDDGTILASNLRISGSISLNNGNGLVKSVYRTDWASAPSDGTPWSSFEPTESGWHQTRQSNDGYQATTYDNGNTWMGPYAISQQATLPYLLSLTQDNVSVAVASDASSSTTTSFSAEIGAIAYLGNSQITYSWTSTQPSSGATGYKVYYTFNNLSVQGVPATSNDPLVLTSLTGLNGEVTFTLYDGTTAVSSATCLVVGVKIGAPGTPGPQGAPGDTFSLEVSSSDTIVQNSDGTWPTTPIALTAYTINGSTHSISSTNVYWKIATATPANFQSVCQIRRTASGTWQYSMDGTETWTDVTNPSNALPIKAYFDNNRTALFDSETITGVPAGSKGEDGDPGVNGTSSEIQDIYFRSYISRPPSAMTTWVTRHDDPTPSYYWTTMDINAENNSTRNCVFKATQTRITTYSGPDDTTGTSTVTCTVPVLYKAYHSTVNQKSYAEFLVLTNNGQAEGISYNTNGNLYINASYINTGVLTVGNTSNPIFSASIGGTNPQVKIGGFTVDNTKLYAGTGSNIVGLSSGNTMIFAGASSNTGSNAKFYVTQAGEMHATTGSIGMWTIGRPSAVGTGDSDRYFYVDAGTSGSPLIMGFQKPNNGGQKALVIGATSWNDWGTGKFYVNFDGAMTATGATITNANISEGSITEATIQDLKAPENSSTSASLTVSVTSIITPTTGTNNYRVQISYSADREGYTKNAVTCSFRLYNNEYQSTYTITILPAGARVNRTSASKAITITANSSDYTGCDITSTIPFSITLQNRDFIRIYGSFIPTEDDTFSFGSAESRWSTIYAKTGTINTSDRREKQNISLLSSSYDSFFDALRPSTYQWLNESITHTGFIAQEVADALAAAHLSPSDFYGYRDENPDSLGLAYSEFISLNTWQIQKLKKRVADLEARCSLLEQKLLNQN